MTSAHNMEYRVASGLLEILYATSGQITWRGTFDESEVVQAASVAGTADGLILVLHSYKQLPNNLMRVRPDGTVVWRAESPGYSDPYREFALQSGNLVAWTGEGSWCALDLECGALLESKFVK